MERRSSIMPRGFRMAFSFALLGIGVTDDELDRKLHKYTRPGLY